MGGKGKRDYRRSSEGSAIRKGRCGRDDLRCEKVDFARKRPGVGGRGEKKTSQTSGNQSKSKGTEREEGTLQNR